MGGSGGSCVHQHHLSAAQGRRSFSGPLFSLFIFARPGVTTVPAQLLLSVTASGDVVKGHTWDPQGAFTAGHRPAARPGVRRGTPRHAFASADIQDVPPLLSGLSEHLDAQVSALCPRTVQPPAFQGVFQMASGPWKRPRKDLQTRNLAEFP